MKQLKITKFPELDYAGSEAFNTLSTNLSFAGETVKKIMITSCHASEGKSYLSMNLMRTLAQRGMKVALVDADLRRSVVNAQYGLQFEDGRNDDKGLSHFLAGMVGMEEVIYQTDIPGALMVPVGRDVPNPLALLSNHHFKDLLDALAQRVDYVLVDAAPVGVVIDAAEIAKSCDGTLIAVQYNDVRRQELLDVKQQIEQSGCPILGTVLNQVDYDSYLSRKYYYRTYGKYGYYNRYYKQKLSVRNTHSKAARTAKYSSPCTGNTARICLPCWMRRRRMGSPVCLPPLTARRAWSPFRGTCISGILILHGLTAPKRAMT